MGYSLPTLALGSLALGYAVTDTPEKPGLPFCYYRGALLIMLIVTVRYHLGGFMLYGLLCI